MTRNLNSETSQNESGQKLNKDREKKTVFSTIVQNLKNVPFAFQVQIEI